MASSPRREFDDVRRLGAGDDRVEPPRPCVEGRALLGRVPVTLIDADDASSASGRVVQDSLRYLEADAELLQIGRDGAAEIMEGPMRQSRHGIRVFAAAPRPFFEDSED